MGHINFEDFINQKRTCEITYGDKKFVFTEPAIADLLNVKGEAGGKELAKNMLTEGSWEEFEDICKDLTIESQNNLYMKILDDLGLSGRLQKAGEIKN